MSDDYIDYGKLVDEAMHYVVRRALRLVADRGLPSDHHFFITFETNYDGVMISDELKQKYPEEMTIVIQHQFWDLEVEEDYFSVVLSFDNVKQSLVIPFDALISFADPSVKFGLQFHHDPIDEDFSEDDDFIDNEGKKKGKDGSGGSNVVTLDKFRKKK